ncbi:hypothetical protein [Nocardioides pelophilus]|uniref:hypothetical protein n=1 Tax=Nocardioides pelophilus TaxID=2172019 RepID=UPI001602527F|nr:hypothetical protein [Nocardioides pelophilus]
MGLRKKKTLLEQAEGYVGAAIDQARDFVQDTALPAISDAKEKAAPVVAAGAATVAEKASEAKVKAAPVVAAGAATVAAKAAEAKGYAETKAAELNGSKPKKRSKVKTLLLLGAVGGGVAVIAKKLQGSAGDSGGWQSSYDPAPPPSPAASVPPPAPEPEPTVADTAADTGTDSGADTAATPEAADPLTDPLPTETEQQ